MKTLLIVESPAKSKTIEKLLGANYVVLSSFGHIRNLDKKNLGIDVENGFRPTYRILTDRNKQIKAIQEKIKTVDKVLLASDEDREGEAIAWHCAIVFKLNLNEKNRICFHEITKSALENAVANPRLINMSMVYSQQARRILDRLVGFKLSPLLWKHIMPNLSAGRVQSVALKVIVEQEKEIEKSTEKKFYKTIGLFEKKLKGTLNVNFEKVEDVMPFLEACKSAEFKIVGIEKNNVERKPPPPYTTSSIQQDIGNRFHIGSKKIMSILQNLYENGHITYHRTDSTNLSTMIVANIKEYVTTRFGRNYVQVRNYKSKIKCAQEAHEAIRPTHIDVETLTDVEEIDKRVYEIIWKRTVASQMSASVSEQYIIKISISNRTEYFTSKAEKIIFDGYRKIYEEYINKEESQNDEDENSEFIAEQLTLNEVIKYINITSYEKYAPLPLRYSEASLVKKMEKIGIGRPSTYSNIIETIIERKYVEKKDIKGTKREMIHIILEKNKIKDKKENITFGAEKKKLVPTPLGVQTNGFLEEHFTNILDCNFTSNLEEKLDNIANGNDEWDVVVGNFYNDFIPNVNTLNSMESNKKSATANKRFLGNNNDEIPVYAYIGKYGPVFQIGEGKDVKYVKIEEGKSVNDVTLNDLYGASTYPKDLGIYNGENLYLKNGKFGFYLSYKDINYKILADFDENLSLEDAIKCIESNMSKKVGDYLIKNGPYGYYITFNKKFYNIPTQYNVNNLTLEQCKEIVAIPKKTYTSNKK